MAYDNTNSGALFKNKQKKSESQPDYKGSINVGGTEYWLSAWIKKSKSGETFMSLALSDKLGGEKRQSKPKQDDDNSIPF